MINKIFNENCENTIKNLVDNNIKIDLILTSPPYNTSIPGNQKQRDNHVSRYDIYIDQKTNEQYIEWTLKLFNSFDKIIKNNGTILWNLSYGTNNSNLMWILIGEIIRNTTWMVGDCIIWKKKSVLPDNRSPNKLSRIIEFIFVFCRKDEYKTYHCNKKLKKEGIGKNKFYYCMYNYIEARNNDGANPLNKATFSTELCEKLLDMYARPNSLVLDPFVGTCTLPIACINKNINFIGSELSEAQVIYGKKRIENAILNRENNA